MKNLLSKIMNEKKLTQTKLAKGVGVSKVAISNIYNESAEPRVGLALKIAEFLNCQVEDLFIIPIILLFGIMVFIAIEFEQDQEILRTRFVWVINEINARAAAEVNQFSWQI